MTDGHLSSCLLISAVGHQVEFLYPTQFLIAEAFVFSLRNSLKMIFVCKNFPKLCRFPTILSQQKRFLNLQENVSHCMLNEYGIKTPRFGNAKTAADAEKIARDLLTKNLVVKAQVLAGGRGLGKFCNGFKGGVHTACR